MRWSCSPSFGRPRSAPPRRPGWRWRSGWPEPHGRGRAGGGAARGLRAAARRARRARRRRSREEALALAETLGRAGWAWAPAAIGALRVRAARPALARLRARGLVAAAGMGGPGAAGRGGLQADRPGGRGAAAGGAARPRRARRGAARPRPPSPPRPRFAFQPRDTEGEPRLMLAEAGTGVGKTLGYLAPGLAVGRGQRPGGVDLDLHPRAAAPDRAREPRASTPTRRSGRRRRWSARAARTTSAC